MQHAFNILLLTMAALAVVVFIALQFINVGYGRFYHQKWGKSISNRWGWFWMEMPIFVAMVLLWLLSERRTDGVRLVFLGLFLTHYFRRSFIFPFQLRGTSSMALSVVCFGIFFNLINATMQGGWLFYISPPDFYPVRWLYSPPFIIGTLLFFAGMAMNIHSDRIIRNLRSNGDSAHYLPEKGMFRYVTSAHYFGELVEWIGFAVLTWSWAGAVFALWTFANLAPRAAEIHQRYRRDFPEQMAKSNAKRLIPFVY